ncbi:NADH:flavin oxidoreductase [Burkholderiales bacterium]|nr:NADH:flavin oxidoreductase [Burkholderiales bacterium]
MPKLLDAIQFKHGPTIKNRFFLAPLTNQQSHEDGTLSDEEYKWLTMRAKGGFGMTMTCASHVQEIGKGFPGQLGIWSDRHLDGLTRLANGIKKEDSSAIVQLHHAGLRSPREIIGGPPVTASDQPESGARGLTTSEVKKLIDDFVTGAKRAEKAGFDGVELHGAHSYILCNFLSADINQRTDEYGGSFENRARILFEIIDGVRSECRSDFILGVRLSAEKFGMRTEDSIGTAKKLFDQDVIDFLDMSLWDAFKEAEDDRYKGQSLMSLFTVLERKKVQLGVAGKIRTPNDAEAAMNAGVDWVMLGRAAMLESDFPNKYKNDPVFKPIEMPVPSKYLTKQGLSDKFQVYVRGRWPEFFAD